MGIGEATNYVKDAVQVRGRGIPGAFQLRSVTRAIDGDTKDRDSLTGGPILECQSGVLWHITSTWAP